MIKNNKKEESYNKIKNNKKENINISHQSIDLLLLQDTTLLENFNIYENNYMKEKKCNCNTLDYYLIESKLYKIIIFLNMNK